MLQLNFESQVLHFRKKLAFDLLPQLSDVVLLLKLNFLQLLALFVAQLPHLILVLFALLLQLSFKIKLSLFGKPLHLPLLLVELIVDILELLIVCNHHIESFLQTLDSGFLVQNGLAHQLNRIHFAL